MNAADKLTKAIAGLIIDQPFFASLALRLIRRPVVGGHVHGQAVDTMATDGKHLYYDEAFVEALSLDECKGVVAHEVMHNAAAHHTRRGQREPKRWNVAGDYAINEILLNSRFTLPKVALHNPAYKDMSSEEIYNLLPEGTGGGEGDGNDPGGCGGVMDAPSESGNSQASEAEMRQAEEDWKIAVKQAHQTAKMQGKLPAGLDRIISDLVEPKASWREILQHFVNTAARNDYSWAKLNKRYLARGISVPSLYSHTLGKIVIAVDTSGSIDVPMLSEFASEISSILQEYDCEVIVMYCDTQMYPENIETFNQWDLPLEMCPRGGGGTDFRPPFDYLAEIGEQPTCIIYFTDGECSSFPDEPNYPVLWALNGRMRDFPFGTTINIT